MEINEFCKKIDTVPLSMIEDIKAEIEALNPVDYGSMFSYERHNGAREMKGDVLHIIDKYIDRKEQGKEEVLKNIELRVIRGDKMTGKEHLIKYLQEHNAEESYNFLKKLFKESYNWTDSRWFIIDWLNGELENENEINKGEKK